MIGPRKLSLVLLAAIALTAPAACGGSDDAKGGTPSGQPGAKQSSQVPQDQAVKFTQCLRQHGLNVADPAPGSQGIQLGDDQTKIDAALKACKQYNPKGDINPNDPKQRDHDLKMQQCLRKHGLNAPDPQPGQPLEIIPGPNDSDAKVQQIRNACRAELRGKGQ